MSVTIWDRWEIKLKAENTLKDLFKMIEDTYKLNPVNVFWKSQPVYMETLMSIEGKEKEKQEALNSKLRTLLELEVWDALIYSIGERRDDRLDGELHERQGREGHPPGSAHRETGVREEEMTYQHKHKNKSNIHSYINHPGSSSHTPLPE